MAEFMEIDLPSVVAPEGIGLSSEERTALRGGDVDMKTWMLAAGRVLRSMRYSSEAHRMILGLCHHPEWNRHMDDLGMVAEFAFESFNDAMESFVKSDFVLPGWSLVSEREDLESILRLMESLGRFVSLDFADRVSSTIDGFVRDLRGIDAWANRNETEILKACIGQEEPHGLRERFFATETPSDMSWWHWIAVAARGNKAIVRKS